MERLGRFLISLRSSPRRALLLEAAFIAPVATMLMAAAVCWTGYFWISHQVQRVADRALAAAERAPDDASREPFARAAAQDEIARQGLAPHVLDVTLQRRAHDLTLLLAYDASAAPAFALNAFMPMPSPTIVRVAQPGRP